MDIIWRDGSDARIRMEAIHIFTDDVYKPVIALLHEVESPQQGTWRNLLRQIILNRNYAHNKGVIYAFFKNGTRG